MDDFIYEGKKTIHLIKDFVLEKGNYKLHLEYTTVGGRVTTEVQFITCEDKTLVSEVKEQINRWYGGDFKIKNIEWVNFIKTIIS